MRNQDEFRLPALIRPHPRISVSGVGFFRIHRETGLRMAAMTIEAKAAGNIERQHDPIAGLNTLHSVPHFVDYAHDFVADDRPLVQRSAAVVHVEITATYPTRCDPEHSIGRALNLWLNVS